MWWKLLHRGWYMAAKSKAQYDRYREMVKLGGISQQFYEQETNGVEYNSLPDKLPPGRKKRRR